MRLADRRRAASSIVGVGAASLVALERRFPYDRGQRFLREGFWTDLVGYTLVQSYAARPRHQRGSSPWIDGATGLLAPAPRVGAGRSGCRWCSSSSPTTSTSTGSTAGSTARRCCGGSTRRTTPTADVDWLAGSRSHALEILINQTIEFAPIVLLGARARGAADQGHDLAPCGGMYIHANVDVRSGRLQWILNGPEMHRWHHAIDPMPATATSPPSSRSGTGSSAPRSCRRAQARGLRAHRRRLPARLPAPAAVRVPAARRPRPRGGRAPPPTRRPGGGRPMPWMIPSHQAPVLPLKRWRPQLVLGSRAGARDDGAGPGVHPAPRRARLAREPQPAGPGLPHRADGARAALVPAPRSCCRGCSRISPGGARCICTRSRARAPPRASPSLARVALSGLVGRPVAPLRRRLHAREPRGLGARVPPWLVDPRAPTRAGRHRSTTRSSSG